MLQRLVYIERGAILGGCILAPVLACLWTYQNKVDVNSAALILATSLAAFTAAGAILGLITHRILALGTVQWGGNEETSALIKTAIGELIGGRPDKKTNDAAIAQANAQEGRATAIYLSLRLLQLRQQGVMKIGTSNPISAPRRIAWSCLALFIGCAAALTPALLPTSAFLSNPHLLAIALLSPIWLTGAAIAALGLNRADAWIYSLKPGTRARQPKLRARGNTSTAGQWHKKDSRTDIPVLRIVLLAPVAIAAALYLLREYGPDLSKSTTAIADFDDTAQIAKSVVPASPKRRQSSPPPQPSVPSAASVNSPTRASQHAAQAQRNWPRIPANGSLLQADEASLSYAGWDISVVSRSLDEAKQRINQGYRSHLRDNPQTIGKIALQLTLQPSGRISDVTVLAAEFNDPAFVNSLRDRLEAVAMPAGAIDPVSVLLSMDFRP
ncbi:MAG: hypothetical protein ACSHXK_03970 [Oceanococcus sp.]